MKHKMKIILIAILGLLSIGCVDEHEAQIAERDAAIAQLQIELDQEKAKVTELTVKLSEPPKLRDFNSLDELKQFLREDKTDEIEYNENKFDCDDFARMLIRNAEAKGYRMHTHSIPKEGTKMHLMCMAFLDTETKTYVVFVEPQTDACKVAGSLD